MYLFGNSNASAARRVISGRSLVHRHLDACQKAAIAAEILVEEVAIKLSMAQLAQLVGVSIPYIRAARQLSPEIRQAIAAGETTMSFAFLLKPSTKPLTLAKPVTNMQLADIICHAGLDRTLEVACQVEHVAAV
jgi:hypothetical protein